MADEKHVALIKQGVGGWNKWREENPDITPDLSGADLTEHFGDANFKGANFCNANLSHANLCNAQLRGANFSSADLHDADLSYSSPSHATFSSANLSSATFCGAILRHADLLGANLSYANFQDVDLRNADFRNADLSHANFQDASLHGADLRSATLRGADFQSANLHDANLHDADLQDAIFSSANLHGADLHDADLQDANFKGANFCDANLCNANLRGTDFSNADLRNADLHHADFWGATLIDSRLDDANLTDAKLWETQRGGWSIKDVICQRAFWDRAGKEPTEYEDGAFERIFAEKPRIVLRYAGGMSPVDLAMLPMIVERLQAEYPNSSLHISSVRDDGSGAVVTITVEDLAGRSVEIFAQDVELIRRDLATLQQRLQQEERLRLQAEASYRTMVQDILPRLLDRALPKMEVHVGQITGPTTIEGTTMSKSTYNIHGQAGAVGDNAHAHDMTFHHGQNQSSIDLPRLAEELAKLHAAMKQETQGTREQDKAIVAVADAEETAINGDGPTTLQHLKATGKWALGIAEKIGVTVAAEALKRAM